MERWILPLGVRVALKSFWQSWKVLSHPVSFVRKKHVCRRWIFMLQRWRGVCAISAAMAGSWFRSVGWSKVEQVVLRNCHGRPTPTPSFVSQPPDQFSLQPLRLARDAGGWLGPRSVLCALCWREGRCTWGWSSGGRATPSRGWLPSLRLPSSKWKSEKYELWKSWSYIVTEGE